MTTQNTRAETPGRPDQIQDPHRSLHNQTGGLPGEHPGRSKNPLVKVAGLVWLEFEKPDLDRLARGTGGTVMAHWGGHAVRLRDPSGYPVHVVYGIPELPALPERAPLPLNFGPEPARANVTQRPERRPAEIHRLGHVALGTTRFQAALDWYLDTLGLIVTNLTALGLGVHTPLAATSNRRARPLFFIKRPGQDTLTQQKDGPFARRYANGGACNPVVI